MSPGQMPQGQRSPGQRPPGRRSAQEPRLVVAARPPRAEEVRLLPVRGPRHERHLLEAEELNALALPVGDDGVVIGTDPNRRPAVLGLFRPRPAAGALVAGSYLAPLLPLSTAPSGARI